LLSSSPGIYHILLEETACLKNVVGFIVMWMKMIGKIFNLGHIFSLLPDSHLFPISRWLFTRFKWLSGIVFIRSFSLVVQSEFHLWILAQLASGEEDDKME
jgi:hypothetical protein